MESKRIEEERAEAGAGPARGAVHLSTGWSAFEAVPDAVVTFTSSGVIVYASSKARRMLRYPEDFELGGSGVFDFIAPEDVQRAAERVSLIMGSDEPFESEYTLVRRDGSRFPAEVRSVRHFGGEAGFSGVVSVIRDLSERRLAEDEKRKLEERMLSRQRMESLGVLAGGVAQKFNNLLVALIGHADLALKSVGDGSQAASNLRKIGSTASRMADISRQMLEFSGKGRFVLESFDPAELVEDTSRLMQAAIDDAAILRCRHEVAGAMIRGDREKIRQALVNVITNASEALEGDGGLITVRTRLVEADTEFLASFRSADSASPGKYVAIEVEDTGCGMSADTMARAFDPFYSTRLPGRGLGLAAVLGIVTSHGGAVRIESEPGRGTSLCMLFPAVG